MAAKYIVHFVHSHDDCSGQGIGEPTIIRATFPNGPAEYTGSQFPSAPSFPLPAGYIQPSPDVIFRTP